MTFQPDILTPIDRSDRRRTAVEVYETLQSSILSGRLKPGEIISQVAVAKALDVSRTPVREAMRMLQEGGLLVCEPNYRSRVVGFDPEDIEALYLKRVVLESLAVTLTTLKIKPALLAELKQTIDVLESEEGHSDFECWRTHHRRLHHLVVSGAGSALVEELGNLEIHSARYQAANKGAHLPGWWHRGEAEHRSLYDAVANGQAAAAGSIAARHLARTALELLAALAPEFDSSRLRESMRFAIAGCEAMASGK
jgi:DNA-binding GntR family transcriptional regulator